ncbi:Rossmann-like and DUF2520 domain-containing protein [Microbulbifer halophilus]|uniref:Rossmann-like and DUF2520 domain-containing protein n=1 Tax=Microbulbifer halophilus TaxID=453963 RepID=A0ABW5E9T8_9GAMM|nr:Rossmann-like and DUF2520 domain-containing protein [Microbulbifer halophilus]MCW8128067.1 DUF2520 domain-containing protein [Microbulbifer halophilus]
MQTLNIIGAGKLGKTLGRLWRQRQVFEIGAICNRTAESTRDAAAFIGAGDAAESIAAMPDADCWLIATGNGQIAEIAEALGRRRGDCGRAVVFHCSGALGSAILEPCRPAAAASAHPVHSFADPALSLETLPGSSVALEGDSRAVEWLHSAFTALDCVPLTIAPENKSLYHAGSVFACNYLTALMDLSLRTFDAAGIDREQALRLLQPIVLQTARNNLQLGPEKALTGPIARGDGTTVSAQLEALQAADPQLAQSYRQLGQACVELARRGGLGEEASERLTELLSEPTK